MSFLPNLYLGTSIAISWAWGTSLILGMQIAQTKGVGAFLLWAAANCLTLVLFGQLYKRGVVTEKILEKPGIAGDSVLLSAHPNEGSLRRAAAVLL